MLRLVRRHNRRPRTLLDVACGTGRHLQAFAEAGLDCTGLDIHEGMLRVAAERCGRDTRLEQGDMTTFDLGRRFDVVTCLFSSIAYSPTVAAMRTAVRRMVAHLEQPGGVLVVEPWFVPEDWENGYLAVLTVDEDDRKAARISRSSRRGDMSILDFDYLIADAGGTRHVEERHELRLFRWDQYIDAFERAGLVVETDDYGLFGRGLLVGTFA